MRSSSCGQLLPNSVSHCICQNNKNPCDICCGRLCFRDASIQAVLKPKSGEHAQALAIDGCLFSNRDKHPRCDGLFVLASKGRLFVLLVELKGTHVDDAYRQLAFTKSSRQEYNDILEHLRQLPGSAMVHVKEFIITNSIVSASTKQKLEKTYGIKPRVELHGKPTLPAPDLRLFL